MNLKIFHQGTTKNGVPGRWCCPFSSRFLLTWVDHYPAWVSWCKHFELAKLLCIFLYMKWKKFRPHHLVQKGNFSLDSLCSLSLFHWVFVLVQEKGFCILQLFSLSDSDKDSKSHFVLKLLSVTAVAVCPQSTPDLLGYLTRVLAGNLLLLQ